VPTFKLLHASDLHLATTPYRAGAVIAGWVAKHKPKMLSRPWLQISHEPNTMRAFAVLAHAIQPEIDALIITGDLATTGRRVDLNAAYSYLTDKAVGGTPFTSAGKPTLSAYVLRKRLDILPGNHDRYRSSAMLYRPGGTVFDQVFSSPHWFSGQSTKNGIAIRRGSVVMHLVKADFSLHKRDSGTAFYYLPGWFGQGKVRHSVLNSLVDRTRRVRQYITSQGYEPFTIWAIHFDPYSTDSTLSLLESGRLADAARKTSVTTILCGHTHESKIKPLSDVTTVYACGTTCQAKTEQNDCQVLEIELSEQHSNDVKAYQPKIHVTWYRYDGQVFRVLMKR
jgi:3',5'-cyclic AMP phosphodiesterase CpdA